MITSSFVDILGGVAASLSVATAGAAIAAALKSGVLKSLKLGPLELEASERDHPPQVQSEIKTISEEVVRIAVGGDFETAQLERYYSQILSQSKVSFWFSLIFASLGFAVIIVAAMLYRPDSVGVTVTQVIAGVIMDAVSSLFFIQSRRAHEAMASFFEKLRKDRLHAESRRLCDEVTDARLKDALRVELILHYAELPESPLIADRIIALLRSPPTPSHPPEA